MPLINRQASSLAAVFSGARAIRDAWNPGRDAPEEIWFRGQPKRQFTLSPGLYRAEARDSGYDELALYHAFASLGHAYTIQKPTNDWEWYFVAQHHGLPTRLLDWTESLLAAVYFAVEPIWRSLSKRDLVSGPARRQPLFDDDSPVVWVVDAGSINLMSHGQDCIFAPPKPELASYLPRHLLKRSPAGAFKPKGPTALFPPRQTTRIIAQQGMFTVHGRDETPIDTLARRRGSTIKLGCITLDRSALSSIIDELILAGITKLALFPDLDSVAAHVKWQYAE